MVSLEFEKPSSWSLGKWIGLIAILLLIIGPFLPYAVTDYKVEGSVEDTDDVSYFNFELAGLWMLIPPLSAILISILLFLKFDINFEKGSTRINIKPFILMFLGFWFFLSYFADTFRIGDEWGYDIYTWSQFAGIGLWMIVIGFFLCALAGFFEWRYPSMAGPHVSLGRPARTEPTPEPVPAVTVPTATSTVKATPEPVVKEAPVTAEVVEAEPIPSTPVAETKKVEAIEREPASEDEKTLMRWARHINEEGKSFEQCMKCQNYVFITTTDTGSAIEFKCPDCGASFSLNK